MEHKGRTKNGLLLFFRVHCATSLSQKKASPLVSHTHPPAYLHAIAQVTLVVFSRFLSLPFLLPLLSSLSLAHFS